jgi:hypothetical protein
MPNLEFIDVARFMDDLRSRFPVYVDARSKEQGELHELIDDVCVLHLRASGEQRAKIRSLVTELPRTLGQQFLSHVGWARMRILSSKDGEWVRRGLAAASIDDNRTDFRDTFGVLGHLYLTATSVGIDCSPYFREAADFSSTEHVPLLSPSCMRDFLANFEQSAYFNEEVRPIIGRYLTPRLRNEILNVLADIWDPLGTKYGRYPRTEYDSYIYDIYILLVKDATDAQITDHLSKTARLRMQMEPPPSTPESGRALRAIKLGEEKS